MDIVVIIKNGKLVNQTLSTVKFDRHGTPTNINLVICESWREGFLKAKSLNCKFALFVDAGTVFTDIKLFLEQLIQYPHKGLIGHIIDPKDTTRFFNLDEQCFFLDLDLFQKDDFTIESFQAAVPQRSDANLHDDYTPLWLKPGSGEVQSWSGTAFGEKLLSAQLARDIVVNWNNTLRDNKKFLYNETLAQSWYDEQLEYTTLAESQLWVFNNEPIPVADKNRLITPASGLCWIKNLLTSSLTTIDLVDISGPQLALAKHLWNTWDGINYGKFVFNFIKQNKIIHVNLDQSTLSDLDRIKLKSSKFFVETVNSIFDKQTTEIADFAKQWITVKNTKQVTFTQDDMVKFLPGYVETATDKFNLWVSNILDYKYTLIKNTSEDYTKFTSALGNAKVLRIYG
jgi:hypothetical protein